MSLMQLATLVSLPEHQSLRPSSSKTSPPPPPRSPSPRSERSSSSSPSVSPQYPTAASAAPSSARLPSVRTLFPNLLNQDRASGAASIPNAVERPIASSSRWPDAGSPRRAARHHPYALNLAPHQTHRPATLWDGRVPGSHPDPSSYGHVHPTSPADTRVPHQHHHSNYPSHQHNAIATPRPNIEPIRHVGDRSSTSMPPARRTSSFFPSTAAPSSTFAVFAQSPSGGLSAVQVREGHEGKGIGIVRVDRSGRVGGRGLAATGATDPGSWDKRSSAVESDDLHRSPSYARPAQSALAINTVPHPYGQQQQSHHHHTALGQPYVSAGGYAHTVSALPFQATMQQQTRGEPAKRHICEVCGAGFSRPSELKTHSHKHTGARPFACVLCGRHFSTSSNLGRHVRSVHPRERERVLRNGAGIASLMVRVGETDSSAAAEPEKASGNAELEFSQAAQYTYPSPPDSLHLSPNAPQSHLSGSATSSPIPSLRAGLSGSPFSPVSKISPSISALRLEIAPDGASSAASSELGSATSPQIGDAEAKQHIVA